MDDDGPDASDAAPRRGGTALLVALGLDNAGAGLFLPLSLLYATAVVGVPLALAGVLVTAGTVIGLLAPPLAGRWVDRAGPRAVVVTSHALQASGMVAYLLAGGPGMALLAAALVAAGTQTFYSGLFALVADVAPSGPKDHAFAVVDVVRSGTFGAGALASTALLALASADALRVAVAVDALSSVLAGVLLLVFVHPARHGRVAPRSAPVGHAAPPVWADRPYLVLIVATGLLALAGDVFLVGLPVYALQELAAPAWVPGAAVALLTVVVATSTTAVVHRTRTWARTTAMAVGAVATLAWAGATAAAAWLPAPWVGPWLLASTLLLAAGAVASGTRANALAEAAAPVGARGRHLAAFQYAFTAAGLLAPLVVSSLTVASWLPWLVVAAATTAGSATLPLLARSLPAAAVRPHGAGRP